MLPFRNEKLLLYLGLAMATITALAFVGMLSSVYLAETTHGDAGAINQAGTLRMQSYRIAATLADIEHGDAGRARALAEEFEQRLHSPRLVAVLNRDPRSAAAQAHTVLVATWESSVRPGLEALLEFARDPGSRVNGDPSETLRKLRADFLVQIDTFVDDIDRFVGLLESGTESKIVLLKFIHVVSLFVTLAVVFVTMYLMHTRVLLPLRDLMACAEAVRGGNFSMRARYLYDDELGQLGQAFNTMADDLAESYADLEARVQAKTADLERSNRSLELLYGTALRLTRRTLSTSTAQALLEDVERVAGVGPSSLCLDVDGHERMQRVASTWPQHGSMRMPLSICRATLT